MAEHKKKIVPILSGVFLFGAALLIYRVQANTTASITPATSPSASPITGEPEELLLNDSCPAFEKKAETFKRPADKLNTKEMFYKMMLAVIVVAGLGAGTIYLSKKLLPKITRFPGKEIRLIETLHLGPRKAIHLLEVGRQRLLISSTSESIRKLADITGVPAETDLSPEETEDN